MQKTLAPIAPVYGWRDYPMELAERDVPDVGMVHDLAGTYRPRGDLTFEVAGEGGGLLVTFAGQRPMRFVATSAEGFAARTTDTELRIGEGDEELVFVQAGDEIVCPRLK